jgi:glycosyltransferase involved in cell wall biosynthesis
MNGNSNLNILVSIVIPAYNAEKYIQACISSALKQTHQNIEVIVVDDCSTDNTTKALKGFDDERLHLVALEENVGGGEARNIGAKHAKGSFVSFLDSDDNFMEGKVAEQLSRMVDQKLNFSYTKAIEEFGVTRGTGFGASLLDDLLTGKARIGSTTGIMVTKELHILLDGFDSKFKRQQDIEYACRASINGNVGFCDFVGYRKINSGSPSFNSVRQGMHMLWGKFRNEIELMSWHDRKDVYLRGYIRFFELSLLEKDVRAFYYFFVVIFLGPSIFWSKRKNYLHKLSKR